MIQIKQWQRNYTAQYMPFKRKENVNYRGGIMALRDFIKPKQKIDTDNEEVIERIVTTFEKNMELYKDKSLNWNVRVTADELEITKDELCEILDKYYEAEK